MPINITSPELKHYNNKSSAYKAKIEAMIEKEAKNIQCAVQNREDLTKLFHKILSHIAEQCHQIANTEAFFDAKNYGIRRDDLTQFGGLLSATVLTGVFKPFNAPHLSLVTPYVERVVLIGGQLKQISQHKNPEIWAFVHEIFLGSKEANWSLNTSAEGLDLLQAACGTPALRGPAENVISDLETNRKAMKNLRANSKEIWSALNWYLYRIFASTMFKNNEMTDFISTQFMAEVNGKATPLTRYVTWIDRFQKEKTLECMHSQSVVTVIHTDPFLIQSLLDSISEIFKKAVLEHTDNYFAIESYMSTLRFKLSHAAPYIQGNRMIADIFEKVVYKYQGYDIEFRDNANITMEALSTPFDEFERKYKSLVVH